MHSHLITVEVGIVSRADQRVDTNGLAFNQDRLKRLDRQAVQGRCAVKEHRVPASDFFKNIPDLRRLALNHLLG